MLIHLPPSNPGPFGLTHQNREQRESPTMNALYPRHLDRGRDSVLVYAAPPTEPCVRLSRTRLSSRQFTSQRGPAPRHWPTQDRPPVSAFRWFGHATFRRSGAGFASGVLALAGNRFRIVSPRPFPVASAFLPPFPLRQEATEDTLLRGHYPTSQLLWRL